MAETVLVTGATGFVGKHIILQLLQDGFHVRGTVRDMAKGQALVEMLDKQTAGAASEHLELVQADLLADDGWEEAAQGVDAVIHAAMVVFAVEPKDKRKILRPAINGTQRVLDATAAAGVQKFVFTSSIAAVGYGRGNPKRVMRLSEDNWTSVEGLKGKWAYAEAKTKAEQLAWDFCKSHGIAMTSILPSMILGPAIDYDNSASLELVRALMANEMPVVPSMGFSIIDVRDVAALHVAAVKSDAVADQRVLAAGDYMKFPAVAALLRKTYPDRKIPSNSIPVWLMKILSKVSSSMSQIEADLETERVYDKTRGEGLLGRQFIDADEAVLASAQSLLKLDLV